MIAYTEADAAWGDIDVAIAVETMDVAARASGLGACWAGYFIRASQNFPKIGERLGLNPDQIIRGGLMIGEIDREIYHQIPYRPEVNVRWIT